MCVCCSMSLPLCLVVPGRHDMVNQIYTLTAGQTVDNRWLFYISVFTMDPVYRVQWNWECASGKNGKKEWNWAYLDRLLVTCPNDVGQYYLTSWRYYSNYQARRRTHAIRYECCKVQSQTWNKWWIFNYQWKNWLH